MVLRAEGKAEQADMVTNTMPQGAESTFVRWPEQIGLGQAALRVGRALCNDPFAVLLADDFHTYEGNVVTADLPRTFAVAGKTQFSVI